MAYIKVKGKTYGIHTGSRGGKYWIDDNGKKHYLSKKEETPKKVNITKKPEPILYTYYCNICRRSKDGEYVDDWNEWHNAYSEEEALEYWRDEYPNKDKYDLTITDWKKAKEDD